MSGYERFHDMKISMNEYKYQKLWVWYDSTHPFEYSLLISGIYGTISKENRMLQYSSHVQKLSITFGKKKGNLIFILLFIFFCGRPLWKMCIYVFAIFACKNIFHCGLWLLEKLKTVCGLWYVLLQTFVQFNLIADPFFLFFLL